MRTSTEFTSEQQVPSDKVTTKKWHGKSRLKSFVKQQNLKQRFAKILLLSLRVQINVSFYK